MATLQFTTLQALTPSTPLDLASVPFGVLIKANCTLDRQEANERGGSDLSSPGPLSSKVEEEPLAAPARTGKTKELIKRANKHA